MGRYTIDDARKIVISCASSYKTLLEGKQFFILYQEHDGETLSYIEPVFLDRNFQHLTGLHFLDNDGNIINISLATSIGNVYRRRSGTTKLLLGVMGLLNLNLKHCLL